MSADHGKFVWYELMTSDSAAAEKFYRTVVGWEARDSGMPGISYTLFSAGGRDIGGLMTLPEEACKMGARPGWIGYVAVDDVDRYASEVKRLGGTVHKSPDDIPGVGRFAIVADPQGAVIALFKGAMENPPAPAPMGTPGHAGWHELYTADREAGFGFYATLFGWSKGEALDMGPMGVYQLFTIPDACGGGMMTRPPQMPVSAWLYYFFVDGIDAAVERVGKAGGTIINGPMEVPGGAWIIQGLDPQGAMFALVAPKR